MASGNGHAGSAVVVRGLCRLEPVEEKWVMNFVCDTWLYIVAPGIKDGEKW
jgi:hypothetical protein